MAESRPSRNTAEKLALFRACFSGLDHVYGTYDPDTDRVRQVKQPVTDGVLLRHLQGIQPYGVYLLVGDRTGAVVADFDRDDTVPPLKFMQLALRTGISSYLEKSKAKGWHAWTFFERPGVSAAKARAVVRWLLAENGSPSTETFPKQDHLEPRNAYGNFVNAPLYGRLVPRGRTVFVDPTNGLIPWSDQWVFLEQVRRVPESLLDKLIDSNQLFHRGAQPMRSDALRSSTLVTATYGLAPCAQRMLTEGVVEHQRVACFRLALHLKKAGLPEDLAVACLRTWAPKNRPIAGKRVISVSEIETQTHAAYSKDYRGCGCEDPAVQPFCMTTCALHRSRRPAGSTSLRANQSDRSSGT